MSLWLGESQRPISVKWWLTQHTMCFQHWCCRCIPMELTVKAHPSVDITLGIAVTSDFPPLMLRSKVQAISSRVDLLKRVQSDYTFVWRSKTNGNVTGPSSLLNLNTCFTSYKCWPPVCWLAMFWSARPSHPQCRWLLECVSALQLDLVGFLVLFLSGWAVHVRLIVWGEWLSLRLLVCTHCVRWQQGSGGPQWYTIPFATSLAVEEVPS